MDKTTNIEQAYSALRELVLTSKILDSVDKPLYSYIIEQKPSSLDQLITVANNYCEAHPGISFPKSPPSAPEVACAQAPFKPFSQQFTPQSQSNTGKQGKKNKKKPRFTTNQRAFYEANTNIQSKQNPSFAQNTNLANTNNQLQLYNNQQQNTQN